MSLIYRLLAPGRIFHGDLVRCKRSVFVNTFQITMLSENRCNWERHEKSMCFNDPWICDLRVRYLWCVLERCME